jgi:hypothetical protein
MIAVSLNTLTASASLFPQVAKNDLARGDWVVLRTIRSIYTLRVLDGGLYEASGGWFDKKGLSPLRIRVSGATWGGSAIMPTVLAACGLRVEFQNRLITSPVQKIVVIRWWVGN